jgi:cytochrome c oxidase subunit 3
MTMVLGAAFLGIKAVEYHHEYEKHLVPGLNFSPVALHLPSDAPDILVRRSELFFVFYFFMTGLHALHMIIGLGILSFLVYFAYRGRYTPEYHSPVEISGLYWHFIDIVWIFLFPLLYLLGANLRHG